MEMSSGNLSDEACNTKAACQCSSNDTDSLSYPKRKAGNDKHHTCSETSNVLSACSVSVNSSPPEGSDEVEEGCNCSNKPKKLLAKESLQEIGPLSDKSEPSSITSLRDVYVGASSLKGDISESSMDQAESSYRRLGKNDVLDSAESAKLISGGDLASTSAKCADQNQDFVSMVVPNVYQPPVRSRPAGCHDGSDLLVDVKVCDICGDAGREDLLAICSKCADGAEHIYCMRIKLDKVPDRNWMCEECTSFEEIEKRTQSKIEPAIGSLKRSNEICQNAGNSSTTANIKTCLDLDIEGSNVKKIRRDNVSSLSQFSVKRNAGDLDYALVNKRKVVQTSVESPRVLSNHHSFDGNRANVRSPTILHHNSPKFRSRLPISRGTLSKSKSFSCSGSKREVQSPEEPPKKRSCGETSSIDKKTDNAIRKISKSVSFDNVSSGCQNVGQSKVKIISPGNSRVEDLKSLKSAKVSSSIQKVSSSIQNKNIFKSDKPRVSLPTTGSCPSPSENGKRVSYSGRTMEVNSSANKNSNSKLSRHSINSSKSSRHVVHEDSKCIEDPAVTGGIKRLRSCLSDVAQNPSSPIIPDSSHQLKGTLRSNSFPTNSRHCGNTGATVQVKFSQSRESSDRVDKAHEGSNFGTASEQIKVGSPQGCKYKDTVTAGESCQIISPRTKVHEGEKGEDVDQCGPIEDPAVTGGIKRLLSCLSDVTRNPSSPIIPDSSHRLKGTLRSNSSLTNSRHCGSTGATAQVKFSQSRESSDRVDKAHEGSNFGTASEQIKVGSPQGCKYKDTVTAGESCQIISPWTKVHEGEKGEDVDQCGPIEDPAVTGGIKRLLSCLSDVTRNPSSPIIPDSSHQLKGTLRSNSFPTNSRHCGSTGATAQVKFSQSRESSDRVDKAHEGSNFGTASEQIKVGSPQGCKNKDTVTAGESCQIISPRTKVHEGEKGEDVDQCGPIDLGRNILLQPDVSRNFAVPSLDFIWKGGFKMVRCARLSSFIRGIQAHVSTRASLKVAEVVKKFPCNILLEEVSCSKTWPTQFRQTKPSEDNIALYFFAEDFESYMRKYKSMVDCMMCYDLALKGNIDELELLIFPSNLLPPTSQRWNNLFFLWGIFRGKKVDNIPCLPSCQNNTSTPNLNYAIPDKNNYIPTGPGFENKHSSGPASECISAASNLYRNVHHLSNFISPPDLPYVSSERNGENHKPELPNPEPELPCPEQKYFGLQTNFDSKARDDTISFSSIPTRKEQLPTDVQDINNFLKEQVLAETKKEIQCLDLNVALETGRTSAKKEKSINLLGTTISIGGGDGDGDDDENSVSLDLSLRL